jgi:hypothetical protein
LGTALGVPRAKRFSGFLSPLDRGAQVRFRWVDDNTAGFFMQTGLVGDSQWAFGGLSA